MPPQADALDDDSAHSEDLEQSPGERTVWAPPAGWPPHPASPLELPRAVGSFHPTTGLPGSSAFRSSVAERVASDQPWALLTLDVHRGPHDLGRSDVASEITRFVAALAEEAIAELGPEWAVAGHLEDTLISLMIAPELVSAYGSSLIRRFDAGVMAYPAWRLAGWVLAEAEEQTARLTIGAIVSDSLDLPPDLGTILDLAGDLQRAGAAQAASTLIVYRPRAAERWTPRTRVLARLWGNA